MTIILSTVLGIGMVLGAGIVAILVILLIESLSEPRN